MSTPEMTDPLAGRLGGQEVVAPLVSGQLQNTPKPHEAPVPNESAARHFLKLLDPEREEWCFRTIPQTGKRGSAKMYRGSLDELFPTLHADNVAGSAVFVVMNEGGAKDSEITRTCALFADFDGEPLPPTWRVEPNLIVETSPRRYQAFWLTDEVAVADFKSWQQRVAATFRTDKSVCNLSRLVRVAGFVHQKGAPFLSSVIHQSGAQPHSAASLSVLVDLPQSPMPVFDSAPSRLLADLRDALKRIDANDYGTWISVGQCLVELGTDGRDLWVEWSKTSEKWKETDLDRWAGFTGDRAGYKGVFSKSRFGEIRLQAPTDESTNVEPESSGASLPDFAPSLLQLPHGLGEIQRWIQGSMMYESAATAGVVAMATLAAFSMGHITVKSYGGLGLNEQYLVLAPTGFGKEDTRRPFTQVNKHLRGRHRMNGDRYLPDFSFSAPASQQGLHRLLEKNRIHLFLADEFAEWLGHSNSDSHKQQCLGYIMQTYSKANGTIAPPYAATNFYKPIENPRVLILATSTAERAMEAFTSSHADSGALNRFVIFVAEQDRIPKRYDGLKFDPPESVLNLFDWVQSLFEQTIAFNDEAWDFFKKHDSEVIEPLRYKENVLAARLSEQALKMSALIALSDRRLVIEVADLVTAYQIREGLYHRASRMLAHDGAIAGLHPTGIAIQQLTTAFQRKPKIYRSALGNWSRKYKKLSVLEQNAVVRSLVAQGICRHPPYSEAVLESLVLGR